MMMVFLFALTLVIVIAQVGVVFVKGLTLAICEDVVLSAAEGTEQKSAVEALHVLVAEARRVARAI